MKSAVSVPLSPVPSRLAHGAALLVVLALNLVLAACGKPQGAGGPGGPGGPGGAPPPAPVQVAPVTDVELNDATEYVATIKSRHSVNVQPQIEGVITKIFVKSGDHVAPGKPILQIDPLKQAATVASQEATRAQKLAALNYAKQDAQRMDTLYKGGAVSKQALDQAQSALAQAQADYEATGAQVREQEVQLRYYRVAAPAAGVVGDIPVRMGDRVTPTTLLTTIDENGAFEVYVSVPIERAKDVKLGLPIDVVDDKGAVLVKTQVSFIAPQVDDQTQAVLVKAPVPNDRGLRADQFVRARVVWSTHRGPVVPVLAVSRINGQYFVFVAEPKGQGFVAHQKPVQLGEMIGNAYVVLSGLAANEKVITSGLQKIGDGAPVTPAPPEAPAAAGAPAAPGASAA